MKYGVVKAQGGVLDEVLDELEELVSSYLAEDSTVRLLGGVAMGLLGESDYHDGWYIFVQAFTYEDGGKLVRGE